jgi:hypothetical protein
MEAEILVTAVETAQTRSGNTRYVVRDDDGNEYSTFRPQIGEEAGRFEGRRARIEYHEEQRGNFRNVYLDAIGPAPEADRGGESADTDAEEAAWNAAVEAAPWLLGTKEPEREVPPEELYERLEPFKDLVSKDIRERDGDDDE